MTSHSSKTPECHLVAHLGRARAVALHCVHCLSCRSAHAFLLLHLVRRGRTLNFTLLVGFGRVVHEFDLGGMVDDMRGPLKL